MQKQRRLLATMTGEPFQPVRLYYSIPDRVLKSKEDVPLVEDFPLVPEEETPEFRELAVTLQLCGVRALEHWQGNTHLTLAAIIVRTVKDNMHLICDNTRT